MRTTGNVILLAWWLCTSCILPLKLEMDNHSPAANHDDHAWHQATHTSTTQEMQANTDNYTNWANIHQQPNMPITLATRPHSLTQYALNIPIGKGCPLDNAHHTEWQSASANTPQWHAALLCDVQWLCFADSQWYVFVDFWSIINVKFTTDKSNVCVCVGGGG